MSMTTKQAINEFLLSCNVEGKSYGTIDCYSERLKGFLIRETLGTPRKYSLWCRFYFNRVSQSYHFPPPMMVRLWVQHRLGRQLASNQ